MGITGYSPTALRKVAGTPELDSGLIDYFAQNEPLLLMRDGRIIESALADGQITRSDLLAKLRETRQP